MVRDWEGAGARKRCEYTVWHAGLCYHPVAPLITPVPDSALRRRWPYALYVALSAFFCAPLFEHPEGLGILDWDQHLFYYASVLKNVVEYGQMPFWNPWYCGGNVLWQNPQIPLLSPVFPLAAIVSLPLAMKINIVLHYVVGLAGMHLLLTEELGLRSRAAVIYLSSLVVFSGGMALHLAVGHSVFLPCLLLPLQLRFCLRAMRTGAIRDMACGGALLALMIYNGALHVVPMSIGALGLLALALSVGRRDWRPLVATIALVVLGAAYAAPKLLPVSLWVSSERFVDARTVLEHPDAMSVPMLLRAYTDRYQDRGIHFDAQRSGWFEYGNYIGGLGATLIAAAMVWPFFARGVRDRRLGVALAVTALMVLLLSAGEFSAWAPASLSNHLPLFSSFRIPSRYTIVFVLFGATAVAWALRESGIDALPSRSPVVPLIAIVCVIGTIDLIVQNREQLRGTFGLPPLERGFKPGGGIRTLATDATSNAYGPDSPMLRALMSDRSFYDCYESLQTRRVATPDPDLVTVSGSARVTDVTFTPNRVEFSATGGTVMAEISLNQNLADGWSSDVGAVVASLERQRPAVRLGPGQHGRFAFTFRPPGLVLGTVIMVLAAGLTILGWKRQLRAGWGRRPVT